MPSAGWMTEVTQRAGREGAQFLPKMPDPGFRFGVKRTGLASLLCAMLRPGDAKAASVNAERVRLVVGSRSREIALCDVETVEEKTGRLWAGIRLGYATGAATV